MKSRHDHWPRARACLVLAEETGDENDRQVLLEMASAWIELGLERGKPVDGALFGATWAVHRLDRRWHPRCNNFRREAT